MTIIIQNKKIFALTILFGTCIATAQITDFSTSNGGEKYSFQKIDFTQVDEYTGKANVSIPISIIKLDDIEIPISVDYLMGGIKVNDLASITGLGWSLNAGGKVYKNVNYIEDNFMEYYVLSSGIGSNKKGYLNEPTNYFNDIPDIYSVNMSGLKSKFLIKKDLSIKEIETFGENKIDVVRGFTDINVSNKYGFKSMYNAQAPCGLAVRNLHMFEFNSFKSEHSNSAYAHLDCPWTHSPYFDTQQVKINRNGYEYDFLDWDHSFSFVQADVNPMNRQSSHHSAYNVTKIKSLKSNKEVAFTYNKIAMADSQFLNEMTFNKLIPEDNSGDVYVWPQMYNEILTYPNLYFVNRISKIKSDEMIVDFIYENSRIDMKGTNLTYAENNYNQVQNEQLLKKVIVKDFNNNVIFTYNFSYGYFNSGCSSNDVRCNRLKLASIEKIGGNLSEVHTFQYYEDVNLPPVNFGKKDAFGYSNGLGNLNLNSNEIKRPKIYLYTENQNQSSEINYYSPFHIPQNNPTTINGEDMSSNFQFTRAWSLKSITYPAKGMQEFEYELNTFKWKGYTFNGGGLRLSKINLKDNGLTLKTINYNYNDTNGTTGSILNCPSFASSGQFCFNSTNTANPGSSMFIEVNSNPILYLTKGANVGYSKVEISETNNGKIVKHFNNPATLPNYKVKFTPSINNTSGLPVYFDTNIYQSTFIIPYDRDNERGLNLKEQIIDENNLIKKQKTFVYEKVVKDSLQPLTYSPINAPFIARYQRNANCTFPNNQNNLPSTGYADVWQNLFGTEQQRLLIFGNFNLKKVTETDFYATGNMKSTKEHFYSEKFNQLVKFKTTNADNNLVEEHFSYANNMPVYNILLNQFRLNEKIKTKVFENGYKTYETALKYANNSNTSFTTSPIESHAKKGETEVDLSTENDLKVLYNRYDDKGNLIEFSTKNGIPTSLIWGYDKTKLIAKIVGVTYDSVLQYVINLQNLSNAGNNVLLRFALNNLRQQLPTAMVTTQTFKPLIGVESETDAKGQTTFYEYDGLGRLTITKDNNGNIISEKIYNIKN